MCLVLNCSSNSSNHLWFSSCFSYVLCILFSFVMLFPSFISSAYYAWSCSHLMLSASILSLIFLYNVCILRNLSAHIIRELFVAKCVWRYIFCVLLNPACSNWCLVHLYISSMINLDMKKDYTFIVVLICSINIFFCCCFGDDIGDKFFLIFSFYSNHPSRIRVCIGCQFFVWCWWVGYFRYFHIWSWFWAVFRWIVHVYSFPYLLRYLIKGKC